ncbi:hypothetical protein ACFE04_030474 [Oxalis oulophora]
MLNNKTGTLGNNTVEDATWLCSLSESELFVLLSSGYKKWSSAWLSSSFSLDVVSGLLSSYCDMLMSLKKLVLQHAKVIGHEELANKFDLKMLRAIGLILMENVKQKTADASLIHSLSKSATRLEKCNLLNTDLQENMDIKEIMTCLGTDSKRRRRKRMKESNGRRKLGAATPCAACKLLRRRCAPQDCVFAPYFPADEPHKFANVHKVFGASNVNKMLQELPVHQRGDAVSSMVYEANARVRDPVYGCVSAISSLQQQINTLQTQLALAQAEVVHLRARQATSLSSQGFGPASPSSSGSPSSQFVGSQGGSDFDMDTLDQSLWLYN